MGVVEGGYELVCQSQSRRHIGGGQGVASEIGEHEAFHRDRQWLQVLRPEVDRSGLWLSTGTCEHAHSLGWYVPADQSNNYCFERRKADHESVPVGRARPGLRPAGRFHQDFFLHWEMTRRLGPYDSLLMIKDNTKYPGSSNDLGNPSSS